MLSAEETAKVKRELAHSKRPRWRRMAFRVLYWIKDRL